MHNRVARWELRRAKVENSARFSQLVEHRCFRLAMVFFWLSKGLLEPVMVLRRSGLREVIESSDSQLFDANDIEQKGGHLEAG